MEPHSTNTQDQSKPGPPHEALYLVFTYLPVIDLLSLTQVCKSFNETIPNDVLTWLHIYIDKPLNTKVSDDKLLKIASRGKGRIKTLALVDCGRVTDHGLQQVIDSNPLIEKLYLPGCTRLSPEGVIRAVKTLTSQSHKLKSLKINNIHHMTKDNLNTLRTYIPTQNDHQVPHYPLYFHNRNKLNIHQPHIHTPSIDVETCPKCTEIALVFDCPRTSCKQNNEVRKCRGCRYCIVRCEECGECVKDEYYGDDDDDVVESGCGDSLCVKCWLLLPKCDFCNKAYCKAHVGDQRCEEFGGSSGFVCSVCLAEENDVGLE